VVLDVYQRQFNWVVEDTHTRDILSSGAVKLFDDNFKYTYDHIKHHQEVRGGCILKKSFL